jgi:hypothetical protein
MLRRCTNQKIYGLKSTKTGLVPEFNEKLGRNVKV